MWPKNLVLYVLVFVLGFTINVNTKAKAPIIKAEYATPIDNDIGIAVHQEVEIPDDNAIATTVRLRTLVVTADDLSQRDIYEDINEYEKEVGSLETISIPPTYLSVSDIQIKDIGETLKIC